ncbi:unnamed protein product [Periconia digitata]|uniref:Uncharacterized protein n=1 Tax=Periconia digitata TaxID=1303443 RepID=A0A9W4UE05_9PLEO|nr:unnamed protein product [Periconia digitata]
MLGVGAVGTGSRGLITRAVWFPSPRPFVFGIHGICSDANHEDQLTRNKNTMTCARWMDGRLEAMDRNAQTFDK